MREWQIPDLLLKQVPCVSINRASSRQGEIGRIPISPALAIDNTKGKFSKVISFVYSLAGMSKFNAIPTAVCTFPPL